MTVINIKESVNGGFTVTIELSQKELKELIEKGLNK